MLSEECDIEAVLAFLRARGHFKMDAIKALMALTGCGLKDAKRTVHLSRTWQDRREADERLWRELADSVKEFEREHSEND